MTPVSGVWQPTVETLPGAFFSSPLAVHHSLVTLDPDFHAVPANQGTVLRDVNGPISPTTLSIDTTQLADGPHKLVIVASHNHLDLGSTQSGVQVIPFTVANGTPPPPPPSLVEKAQGRPATASSTEDPSLAPANGNDGNASTRWASSYADGQWWQVDLGSSQSLSRVTVNWEAAYCSSYHVAVSPDASTWTTVVTATRTASGLATHDFPAASGRYLRLTCDQRATQWGSSFWELKAYG